VTGAGELNLNVSHDDETSLGAMLIAGCAICLVAIAIILLIYTIVMKSKSGGGKLANVEEDSDDILNDYHEKKS